MSARHSDPELFRSRFALLRRVDATSEQEQRQLDDLLDHHPRMRVGWHVCR
ncbi:MAG TPA: hypothetical protein VF711_08565 [Acidimicrobiales bacterium]